MLLLCVWGAGSAREEHCMGIGKEGNGLVASSCTCGAGAFTERAGNVGAGLVVFASLIFSMIDFCLLLLFPFPFLFPFLCS
jgi:hypothetical protein